MGDVLLPNLTEAAALPLNRVGGKAAALSRLLSLGAPVPAGIVVPPDVDLNAHALELTAAAKKLQTPFLAVRSSAVGEDSSSMSWAGQLESYLFVTPDEVPARVADCRASRGSARALAYANTADLPVAVIVQVMVAATSAGVLFTVNPVTKNSSEIVVEAVFGLGELLVQGLATPDNYRLSKDTGNISQQSIATKRVMMLGTAAGPAERPVPKSRQLKPALSKSQLADLATIAKRLEADFAHPLDIEFAYTKDVLYILQARPVTTL
jgi:phosphoenolpyruvate synthase/pyruvate phosphate dikinase